MSADLSQGSYFSSFLCGGAQATVGYRVMNMEWRTVGFLSLIGGTIDDCWCRHLVLFHLFCPSTCIETALPGSDPAAADRPYRARAALAGDITGTSPGDDELSGISRIPL